MKAPQLIVGAAAVVLASISWPAAARQETVPQQARRILDFCLANADKCSLSVRYLTGGWERHIRPDRLNPLASSWKVVPLVAYGEAVADGELHPQMQISRDEWGRFYAGGDGGALQTAWSRFGSPGQVTLDQMVDAMMRESDNATPDWLLDRLGGDALQRTIETYVTRNRGYHDIPKSIAAMFLTWDENPFDPIFVMGDQIAASFSDFSAYGYGPQLDAWFNALHDPAFVELTRMYRCAFLPWFTPPPCTPPAVGTSEANLVRLQQAFYMRSSTRTYTDLMAGLLDRQLVPSGVQAAIEKPLEWRLASTGDRFVRYGAKSGTLGTVGGLTVVNWTTYVEARPPDTGNGMALERGVRAAVTLHLRGNGDYIPTEFAFIRASFAEALVEDAAFAQEVFERIPAEQPRPDLIARVANIQNKVIRRQNRMTVDLDVFNAGPAASSSPAYIAAFLSQDNQLDLSDQPIGLAVVPALQAGARDRRRLTINLGATGPNGVYLITVVDPWNMVEESEEAGNVIWEKIGVQ